MNPLCQRCGIDTRIPKERFCEKCGKTVRAEARRKAWEESPDPVRKCCESRGRKGLAPDKSPIIDPEDF